jgi:hypothetical protein
MERRTTRLLSFVLAVLAFWTIAAPSAHAYIDPGSTNFLIQILIGAVAGAGLAIATFWRLSKNKSKDEPAAPGIPAAPTDTISSNPPSPEAPTGE